MRKIEQNNSPVDGDPFCSQDIFRFKLACAMGARQRGLDAWDASICLGLSGPQTTVVLFRRHFHVVWPFSLLSFAIG